MSELQDGDKRRDMLVRVAFGVGALICVLGGLVLYLFAAELGFDPETAELVAIAFLAAGFIDYLVLRFWGRIMTGLRK